MKRAPTKVGGASSSPTPAVPRKPAAHATTPSDLRPRLRFPEFRKAPGWEEKPLKEAALINPTSSGLPDSFVYIDLESVVAGELKAKTRISRTGAPSRAQRLVERGDIIYQVVRPYQRNNLLCEFDDDDLYVASTGYAQLRANGSNHFLYHSIHTDLFVGRVMEKCTGSSYPAINSSDLSEIEFPIPQSIPEQHRIASCLSSLDDLLAAERQKLDALKAHKQGLLQQLFPREGETRPRLRFPEFRKAGEWAIEALGQLAVYENGKAYEQDITETGKYVVVNSRFISTDGKIRKYSNAEYLVAKSGEVLMVLSDLPKGKALAKCYFVDANDRYAVNQRVCRLIPNRIDGKFLYYVLNRHPRLLAFDDGLNQTHLGKGSVIECPLCVPQKRAEQERIASCLSSLDDLIAAQNDKLEALKTHKKGLMQQMFPAPEAVEA